MNRFDGIIEFQPQKENLLQIVTLMLADEVNQRLAQNEIHLMWQRRSKKNWSIWDTIQNGARPLRRTIQDHIEDAITDYYLENPEWETPQSSHDQAMAIFKSNLQRKSEKQKRLLLK